ncbi:MAG TPA: hypothetical protein VFJ19_07465 [Nocardioidaceae bacterium]|nr:hypothetical protein [Nocardioidaceae bacterium]
MTRLRLPLAAIGVLALVAAGLYAYLTARDTVGSTGTAPTASHLATTRYVSHRGGFSVRVPHGYTSTRNGRTTRFANRHKTVVVTIGPVGSPAGRARRDRAVRKSTGKVLAAMRHGYRRTRVLGHRHDRVDGRKSLITYGRVRTHEHQVLRFVVVVVPAKPRDYAITVFTAARTDPTSVLPRVEAFANSFHVRGAAH